MTESIAAAPENAEADTSIAGAAASTAAAPGGKGGDKSAANGAAATESNDEGFWPDDWRARVAGDDKKALEQLGRFATPADVFKSLSEAQRKISEGVKPKAKPGPDAKPEEWAEYRKSVGIPEDVADYVKSIELPDKREVGEADKPVIEAFAKRAVAAGIAPDDMAALVDEYYLMQEDIAAERMERDAEFRKAATAELKEEYGGDYTANVNALRPYFDGVDGELFDGLMGGRLADGTKIGDHPGVIRFFVAKALAENPAATIVPNGGGSLDSIESEIAKLEKRMGEDRDAWFKDDRANARLQKLYEARDKLAAK